MCIWNILPLECISFQGFASTFQHLLAMLLDLVMMRSLWIYSVTFWEGFDLLCVVCWQSSCTSSFHASLKALTWRSPCLSRFCPNNEESVDWNRCIKAVQVVSSVEAILGLHGSSKTQWERGTNWGCVEWGGFACQSWLSSSSHKPTFIFIFLDEPEWTSTNFSWVWCWSHVVFNTCSSVVKSLLRKGKSIWSPEFCSEQAGPELLFPDITCHGLLCQIILHLFCPWQLILSHCFADPHLFPSQPLGVSSLLPILGMKFGLKQKKKQKERQKVGNFLSFFWQIFFLFEMTYGRATFMRQLKATG